MFVLDLMCGYDIQQYEPCPAPPPSPMMPRSKKSRVVRCMRSEQFPARTVPDAVSAAERRGWRLDRSDVMAGPFTATGTRCPEHSDIQPAPGDRA